MDIVRYSSPQANNHLKQEADMCSSPRSSGHVRPRNISTVGAFSGLSSAARQNFTEVANAAADRRERLRLEKLEKN